MIADSGERLGVLSLPDALTAARERDLDLVEVSPTSVPPVCRILDYGKYKYEQAKKDRGAPKQHHHGELREVRFKVKISPHDLEMKVRRADKFLREGDKVKVSVMFRGREIVHPELGRGLLERVAEQVGDAGTVDKPPTMEGRFFNMILAPGKLKEPKPKPAKQARAAEPTQEAPPVDEAPAIVESPSVDLAPATEETPPAEVPVASEG